MSASDKKKLRKEQNAAAMSEKQKAAQKKQATVKAYTLTFAIAMVLVVALVLCAVLQAPVTSLIWNNTVAATVNGEKLSANELNYYYYDTINEFYSEFSSYGDYADIYLYYYTGLYPSKALDEQYYDEDNGVTWADYFVDLAIDNAKWTYTMYAKAVAENFELPEDQQSALDSMDTYYDLYANYYGYSNKDAYIRAMYGDGATYDSFVEYSRKATIANAYASDYYDSLSFDGTAISEYQADKMHKYNSYSYGYYFLDADKYLEGGTESTDEDGKTTVTYSDAEKEAALAAALEDAKKLVASGVTSFEELDKLIAALSINIKEETEGDTTEGDTTEGDTTEGDTTEGDTTEGDTTEGDTTEGDTTEGDTTEGDTTEGDTTEGDTAEEEYTIKYLTKYLNQVYAYLEYYGEYLGIEDMTEWVSDSTRTEHEMTYLPMVTKDEDGNEVTEGYYVVYFSDSVDNTQYRVGDVRHLLVAFEEDDDGNLVENAREKALEKAQDLLAEYNNGGAKGEEAFAELIKNHSDDTEDGLYEAITPDSGYVTEFWQWACAEHLEGDVEIIETEYGFHIMYYIGCDELVYRDYLVHADMVSEAYEAWEEELLKDIITEIVNGDFIERDLIISGQ